MNALLEIGAVKGAYGRQGLLRVRLYVSDPQALVADLPVRLRLPQGEEVEHRVTRLQPGSRGLWILGLRQCTDRAGAEALRGAHLLVHREVLPPLAPDEFYLGDTVGCPAEGVRGEVYGDVEAIGDNGAQPLLIIRQGDRRFNVPAVPEFITDFDGTRIVLDLPDGLLEAVIEVVRP